MLANLIFESLLVIIYNLYLAFFFNSFLFAFPFRELSSCLLTFSLHRMVRPRKTPLIRSTGFDNPSDLTLAELRALSLNAVNDLPGFLAGVGWNLGAYGAFTLSLSPDNQRVLNGAFNLIGSLFNNRNYNAALYWPTTTPVTLSLSLPDLSIFHFPNSSLVSNYVPSSALTHSFNQNNVPLPASSLVNLGITPFCIRAHIYPTTDSFVKIILSLSPSDETRLQSLFPFHDDPRFPAIKLGTFEFPMGPSAATPPLNRQWGFPIVPILLPGSPWLDSSSLPSGADLRFALSSMLSSATLPDSKQNFATYNQRCEYLLSVGPTGLKSKPPPIAWPPAPLVSHTSVLQG